VCGVFDCTLSSVLCILSYKWTTFFSCTTRGSTFVLVRAVPLLSVLVRDRNSNGIPETCYWKFQKAYPSTHTVALCSTRYYNQHASDHLQNSISHFYVSVSTPGWVELRFQLSDGTISFFFFHLRIKMCAGRWPRGLRLWSAAARLLGLRARIPPVAWMSLS
jgi:hypothetical protein